MNKTYLRGDIYYADLGFGLGSEQAGHRPVVIVQNNIGNKHSSTVIVAAISSQIVRRGKQPTHHIINADFGLNIRSVVMTEQLRTIDKQRLTGYLGHINKDHMDEIDQALAVSVGLDYSSAS